LKQHSQKDGEVAAGNPEHLALANHLCCLDPLNRSLRRGYHPWPLHRAEPAFDVTVIGLDSVIAVSPRSLLTSPVHVVQALQFTNGGRIAAQAVARQYTDLPIVGIRQGSLEEGLSRFTVPRFRQVEIDRLPAAIDSAEQVHPTAGDPHEGFIDVPCGRLPLDVAAEAAVDLSP